MLRRVAFDPDRPLQVRRAFDRYRVGDAFDASRCNVRRVGQLYRSGFLVHSDGEAWRPVVDDVRDALVQPEQAAVAAAVEPEVVVEAEQAPVGEDPEPSMGLEFVNTGAGWYNVQLAGVVINDKKIKGLEAAKAWATEQGYC